MKRALTFVFFSLCLFSSAAQAKPSYSFGDEPRRCKSNDECVIIMVDCHNCGWADSVNKKSLKASEKIVKDYCAGWEKQEKKEPKCAKPLSFSKREALCNNNICEARTFP